MESDLEREGVEAMPPDDVEEESIITREDTQTTMMPFVIRNPLDSLMRHMRGWNCISIENQLNSDFMPPIGCTATDGHTVFAPKPKTPTSAGNVLACVADMGRGKSTMMRNFQRSTITGQEANLIHQCQPWHNPAARFLLLTANRMYAASASREQEELAAALRDAGYTPVAVGSYMTEGIDLAACQFVLCSLESLHHVEGQRFDAVVLDEVGSIARLVGGGTMQELGNVSLLRQLCRQVGARVIALDADLLFKMDSTEPRSVVEDFFKLVMPEREVLCAKLAGEKPQHLQRSVSLYFNHSLCDGEAGKKGWLAGIDAHVERWHSTQGEYGLAIIAVGTKKFGREVCKKLFQMRAPYKFYHGDSNQEERFEHFSDLSTHWQGLCVIVVTTVLAIGVDIPADIKVALVFAAFCRMGCSFQQECQALLRARHVQDAEIRVLIDCMPPPVHNALVQQGKRKPIVRPTYDEALKYCTRSRASGMRFYERELSVGGGLPACVARLRPLSDDALRVMAHARFERNMQISDPYYAITRLLEHHGWGTQLGFQQQTEAQFDVSRLAALNLSDDAEFDLLNDLDKWAHVAAQIYERGETGFFDNCCYDLATKQAKSSNTLSQVDQWLVKAYWALINIGFVPDLDDLGNPSIGGDGDGGGDEHAEEEAPAAAVLLKAWLGNGADHNNMTPHFKLHALCQLFTPEEALKRDHANHLNSGKRKRDPQLKLPMGAKVEVIGQVGKLLLGNDYRCPAQLVAEEFKFDRRFIELANRDILKTPTESDTDTLKQLRGAKDRLDMGGKHTTLLEVLRAIFKAIGMKLEVEKKKEFHDGKRRELVKMMWAERLLPEVTDAWLVCSDQLGAQVRVDSWERAHANAQLDALETGFSNDRDFNDLFTMPYQGQDSDDARWEKINSAELDAALTHLRHVRNTFDGQALTRKIERDLQELSILEAIDNAAEAAYNGIRRLRVIYGKRSGLGRRTASSPSMQACPSSLRPILLKLYYHDIDIVNCHPTLMIQVAEKMGKLSTIPRLVAYVTNRDVMLQEIARHFGVDKAICKFAVLRVVNGGTVQEWCKDIGLPATTDTNQRDLRDLAEEARVIRDAFFEMTEQQYPGSLAKLRELARSRKGADASQAAIDRSVFSHCIFEIEDSVLSVVDKHFRSKGWNVASLIYDGMHVEHRDSDNQDPQTGRWMQLEAVMQEAENAVQCELGYKVELKEKPLFESVEGMESAKDSGHESVEEIEYAEE